MRVIVPAAAYWCNIPVTPVQWQAYGNLVVTCLSPSSSLKLALELHSLLHTDSGRILAAACVPLTLRYRLSRSGGVRAGAKGVLLFPQQKLEKKTNKSKTRTNSTKTKPRTMLKGNAQNALNAPRSKGDNKTRQEFTVLWTTVPLSPQILMTMTFYAGKSFAKIRRHPPTTSTEQRGREAIFLFFREEEGLADPTNR
ncbi:hypothetical protein BaRGS_00028130 [Batillaria attramentaria]|uniref:Uncharacterized protein n=1 Tax=Batillaria attramentaria TaxID=370345 RepID=A0ABD0K1C3_9CAEN